MQAQKIITSLNSDSDRLIARKAETQLAGAPQVEDGLLKRDFRRWDKNEEADPVERAEIQVLCAGVGYGTNVRQQLPGHC